MIFSCMHFSSVVEMLNHDGKLQFMKPFLVYVLVKGMVGCISLLIEC